MLAENSRSPLWRRLETWFLASAVLILLVTGFFGWSDLQDLYSVRATAKMDRDAVEDSITILSAVREAEADQRAFIWTGNEKDLQSYRTGIVYIPAQLRKLRHDASAQTASIEKLDRAITLKLKQLTDAADIRRASGVDTAMTALLSDGNRTTTEEIRRLSRSITSIKYAEYVGGSKRVGELVDHILYFSVLEEVVPCLLLLLAAVSIHSGTKRRDALIGELQENERKSQILREKAEIAESRVRNILESIADGFISFNHDWAITYCNAEAGRIFGRPQAEVTGKNFWREFPDLASGPIEVEYKAVSSERKPRNFEVFVASRNQFWEQGAYPSPDGLTVYLRDVTERKRFEERARHAHKLESLGVLAGGIAHDFNNLLTAILGSASLMLDDLPADTATRSLAENVVSASELASQLTRQMLAYSGRGRFVVENLDLGAQVKEIKALLETAITSGVELVLDLTSDGVLIEADAGQIQQLVMNLVINGAEAIQPENGRVRVSTRVMDLDASYVADNLVGDTVKPGLFVVMEVHDTGSGMDEVTLARIFDPFFTTKFTGRGLGLAAVLGIVRGHNGGIKVYSNPGSGTTFKVFFPVVAGQAKLKPVKVLADYTGNATVLVVDDEAVVRKLAQSTLERYGYKVVMASNGLEAIKVFQAMGEQIALVLLDMTMPIMSGEETLSNLRRIRPDLCVVASSGYNEVEALRRFGQGVSAFLQKPYRAVQLAEKVKVTLG